MLVNPIVYISFWDHTQGHPPLEPLKCEIIGILAKEDKLSYYIVTWVADGDLHNSNSDWYCVLKSAVVSFKQLKVVTKEMKHGNSTTRGYKAGSKKLQSIRARVGTTSR